MSTEKTNPQIRIVPHSGLYTLTAEQFLPIPLREAWAFFSNPSNLARITPEHMGFHMTSDPGERTYPGQIITYKVGIFPGVRVNWVTEITHCAEESYFVDEQRFGPYTMWHHEHRFEAVAGGTLMTDRVTYKLPLGFVGRLFHPLLVAPQLRRIFGFRREVLERTFPVA